MLYLCLFLCAFKLRKCIMKWCAVLTGPVGIILIFFQVIVQIIVFIMPRCSQKYISSHEHKHNVSREIILSYLNWLFFRQLEYQKKNSLRSIYSVNNIQCLPGILIGAAVSSVCDHENCSSKKDSWDPLPWNQKQSSQLQ